MVVCDREGIWVLEAASVILIALAVSLDGLGVGLAYGLRRIHIPWASLLLLGGISSALAFSVMLVGREAAGFLPAGAAERLGGFLLLAVGLFYAYQAWRRERRRAKSEDDQDRAGPLLAFRLKPLGLMVTVWHDPETADWDRSGRLETGEAVVLGLALALDGVAAGIGAAFSGWSPYGFSVAVGLAQVGLVALGRGLPARVNVFPEHKAMTFLPAVVLLVVATLKLLV